MKMKLKPGVRPINFITYAIVYLVMMVAIMVIYSFVVFILTDPNYYDVDEKDIGTVMGTIGMYSEFFVIAADLFIGVIIDTFGRKSILIIG